MKFKEYCQFSGAAVIVVSFHNQFEWAPFNNGVAAESEGRAVNLAPAKVVPFLNGIEIRDSGGKMKDDCICRCRVNVLIVTSTEMFEYTC